MKKFSVIGLILLAVCGLAQTTAAGGAAASNLLHKSLISQSQAVAQAQKAKDADTLKRLLTDDFEQVGSEGKLHDKEEFVGDAKDGKLKDVMLYNLQILPVNDSATIVTYDAVVHMSEGDDVPAPRYQHFSDLWVKQGEQWRLRFQQSTARRPID